MSISQFPSRYEAERALKWIPEMGKDTTSGPTRDDGARDQQKFGVIIMQDPMPAATKTEHTFDAHRLMSGRRFLSV